MRAYEERSFNPGQLWRGQIGQTPLDHAQALIEALHLALKPRASFHTLLPEKVVNAMMAKSLSQTAEVVALVAEDPKFVGLNAFGVPHFLANCLHMVRANQGVTPSSTAHIEGRLHS